MKRILTLSMLFLTLFLGAQEVDQRSWIDWDQGRLYLEISAPIPQEGGALPTQRIKAEALAESRLTEILTQTILNLPLESGRKVQDWVKVHPLSLTKISELAPQAIQVHSIADEPYRNLIVRYSLKMFPDIMDLFSQESGSQEPPFRLENRKPGVYSGLVIYAKGPLKIWGEEGTAQLERVLFPRIYNTDGELVYDPDMVSPEFKQTWGAVTYEDQPRDEMKHHDLLGLTRPTPTASETPRQERLLRPLRLVAHGVTGKPFPGREGFRGDIVLSTKDLAPLLSSDENRLLFKEGRILVICDKEVDEGEKKD